ncbi:uncharacterized protein AMSG_06606 [Thecamonas trahens ATCC 50062]|uniref:Fringe-like glycosyltransferase domain-containing protein n=1 Tax=Thecamonas trahens ATCC 50062 TaxID=461836 RepID=A0A0L0DEG0_THETB|nr:hypothetical protein AMSG_06606 [Thecamonas trahens ATCC 50062]KNC50717.1 hypothetical protein AMSG_06606 [Thecamonas trahens ATCC 50062]|eukprot:XP_013756686.1 hypothetical protein AMSG_06606 [Thecamonas trahens ATCC 50062]
MLAMMDKGPSRRSLQRSHVAVGVFSGIDFVAGRIQACANTWAARTALDHVVFVIESVDDELAAKWPAVDLVPLPPRVAATACTDASKYSRCTLHKNWHALTVLHARAQAEELDIRWYLTVGCDTYVATANALAVLDGYDHTRPHLVGQCWHLSPDAGSVPGLARGGLYANGGGGIAISAALMDILAPRIDAWIAADGATPYSDLSIAGLAAEAAGAVCEHSDAFHGYAPRWYAARPRGRDDPWGELHSAAATFHYMSPHDQYALSQQLGLEATDAVAAAESGACPRLHALARALVRDHHAVLEAQAESLLMCAVGGDAERAARASRVTY